MLNELILYPLYEIRYTEEEAITRWNKGESMRIFSGQRVNKSDIPLLISLGYTTICIQCSNNKQTYIHLGENHEQ
jgi:hypothetical protein